MSRERVLRGSREETVVTTQECYDLLELDRDKSPSEADITEAYKRLAIKYHPDKYHPDKEFAEEMFKRVSLAWEILCPVRRAGLPAALLSHNL